MVTCHTKQKVVVSKCSRKNGREDGKTGIIDLQLNFFLPVSRLTGKKITFKTASF